MDRIIYRRFDCKRRFGVELEVSTTVAKYRIKNAIKAISKIPVKTRGWGNSVNNSGWEIKDDATCGPEGKSGFEIASYVGSEDDDIEHIAEVAEHLRRRKVQVNDFCGFHIHADGADLSEEQVGTIAAYWLKIESIFGMSLPSRRRSNDFCRNLRSRAVWPVSLGKRYTARELWDTIKPEDLSSWDNPGRRATLNLVNYARGVWFPQFQRKTLELRWPEGTLQGRDVENWIRLFLHFIETAKDRPMPSDLNSANLEEMLGYLGLHHEGKTFCVLSKELMEVKTWFLERLRNEMCVPAGGYWYGKQLARKMKDSAVDLLNKMWEPIKKYD